MPSVASIKKDLEALRTKGQEEILNYLEEVIVLGLLLPKLLTRLKLISIHSKEH